MRGNELSEGTPHGHLLREAKHPESTVLPDRVGGDPRANR